MKEKTLNGLQQFVTKPNSQQDIHSGVRGANSLTAEPFETCFTVI